MNGMKQSSENKKYYIVLGIETSCDETAASLIRINSQTGRADILSNIVHSQIKEHQEYGGVIPEFAARAHLIYLPDIIKKALTIDLSEIDAVCATVGPGLIGGLHVGVCFAKSFAKAIGKPFIPINHLEGHALTACLTNNVQFPFLLLLISGGHTQIMNVKAFQDYEVLGSTLDDSLGEVFDKTAKLMGLPYPGGPQIEILAKDGNPDAFDFPKPLYKKPNCDFSFSGLKTAIRLAYEKTPVISSSRTAGEAIQPQLLPGLLRCTRNDGSKEDIAASLQKTVLAILIDRLKQGFAKTDHKTLVVAGGVAANQYICKGLKDFCIEQGVDFQAPPLSLCTDNAAMIAYVGGHCICIIKRPFKKTFKLLQK